jgi:hypothetical protein
MPGMSVLLYLVVMHENSKVMDMHIKATIARIDLADIVHSSIAKSD